MNYKFKSIVRAVFNGKCHEYTFVYVFYNVVISLLPLIVGICFILLNKWQGWSFFWENGEFYIYSAVFMGLSLFTLQNLGIKKNNSFALLLNLVSVVCLGLSITAYVTIIYNKIIGNIPPLVGDIVDITSWILFSCSIFIFYMTSYWNYYITEVIDKTNGREDINDIIKNIH